MRRRRCVQIHKKNPQSLALFEKKIKTLCREVRDKMLSKYFLDSFMKKINELTPNISYRKNNFSKFKKIINPLQETKDIYLTKWHGVRNMKKIL